MVKWKSYLASNEMVQVQLLVELLIEKLNETEGLPDWRREPVGSRSSIDHALRVRLPLLPLNMVFVV